MIAEDLENLREQLVRISLSQNGQLYLGQQDADTLFRVLGDIHERIEEVELSMCPYNPQPFEQGLAAAAGQSKFDSTNVVVFPKNKLNK